MVSEPPFGCWADLPPNYDPRVWLFRHMWGGILKRESCPTLTKYSWVVQLISHGQSSSLKASFEIELGPLDFNMVSEPPLGCWADLPLNYDPRVWLVCHTWEGILKWESCPTLTKYSWVMQLISHGQSSSFKASFKIELDPLDFNMVSELGYPLQLVSQLCSI